jgi:Fic family protein
MYLWDLKEQSKVGPSAEDVQAVWLMLMQERVKDFREILQKRSQGQIKILSLLALKYTNEITSQDSQAKLGVSSSAIVQSLRHLEEEDYIERLEKSGYRIIDPMLTAIFLEYGADYFI